MQISTISYLQYDEVYAHTRCKSVSELADFYAQVRQYASQEGLTYVHSHIFADLSCQNELLWAFYEERVSIIFGRYGAFVNASVFFVKIKDASECKISGSAKGICLEFADRKMVYLDGIRTQGNTFEEETLAMYSTVEKLLQPYGLHFLQVERSWNFIHNILQVYPQFNRARDTYFGSIGLQDNFPAGTGIDCQLVGNSQMNTNIFALDASKEVAQTHSFKTKRQCEAASYGPKFSRAKSIRFVPDRVDKLFVSGTAAVGSDGSTLFPDDITQNIAFTMGTVQDLLAEANMEWKDVKSSFVYLKKPEFLADFEAFYTKNGFSFPYIYNFCDVCRDDWLFEIECIAAREF